MSNTSFWFDNVHPRAFPSLRGTESVDVAVIGGGMTGILTTYLLSRAGVKVALLDRYKFGRGDTGNTTAHLTYVTDRVLSDLVNTLGKDGARMVWEAGRAGINEIEKIVRQEGIDCGFTRVPAYFFKSFDSTNAPSQTDFQREWGLAREFDFEATLESAVPIFGSTGVGYPHQAIFHPICFISHLLDQIQAHGGLLFENSPAIEVEHKPTAIRTPVGELRCNRIIIATHNPIVGLNSVLNASLFQTKLALYTSYVVSAKAPAGSLPEGCYWDNSDPYYYLRVSRGTECDHVIFGGRDHKTGQMERNGEIHEELETILQSFVPSARHNTHWSGQLIETNDGVPYIGQTTEDQFIATGFCGNGLTFGAVSAIMARDWIGGVENPWTQLFDPSRNVPASKLGNYVKENFDFPRYLVADYLRSNKDFEAHALHPGEGGVFNYLGKRVAVYKDYDSQLTVLSPKCTHLGCVVHWNANEGTWDCPCHGSRFAPKGEIMAGPAEKNLPEIK